MTQFTPRKSSPRLQAFDYRGTFAYFITTNTDRRQRVLSGDVADYTVEALNRAAQERSFEVMAYTVMPDHLHLLVNGTASNSDLTRFMQLFKQLTGFRYQREAGHNLWHRSYYDHVLRDEDDAEDIAAYIWHNPVRAGLAKDAASYSWNGPLGRLGASSFDRTSALSQRLGPLFAESAAGI